MHRHMITVGSLILAFHPACTILAAPQHLTPDQQKILDSVRAGALEYTHKLPDFICTQITHRQVSNLGSSDFNTGVSSNPRGLTMPSRAGGSSTGSNVIEERLTYFQQSEKYEVVKVDGKKVTGLDHMDFQGAISAGEFGSSLREVFDPHARTAFQWERTARLHDRSVIVFAFQVPAESGIILVHRDTGQQVMVPYTGKIYVDAQNLAILQLDSTLQMPPAFPIRMCQRHIAYGPVVIAGRTYTLPQHSEVRMKDSSRIFVNEIDFRAYQKFAVESTIHYDTAPQ